MHYLDLFFQLFKTGRWACGAHFQFTQHLWDSTVYSFVDRVALFSVSFETVLSPARGYAASLQLEGIWTAHSIQAPKGTVSPPSDLADH